MLNRTFSLTYCFRQFCALPRKRYDEPEMCRHVVNSQLADGKGLSPPKRESRNVESWPGWRSPDSLTPDPAFRSIPAPDHPRSDDPRV